MQRPTKEFILLVLIVVFAFTYRVSMMLWENYPPGADIGLHNSIIHSITRSGNTNFTWNYYQMGGGLSLTFPGYHIFVSYIMFTTGLADYVAQTLVVSLFSSLIVICAFLLTKIAFGTATSMIVAFLVAVSRFDIEMLLWGGFPNAVALMLMPLIFYLYLQRAKFSLAPFLATTALLCSAMFFTHSLNALIFVSITFVTVLVLLIFSKRVGISKSSAILWLLPIVLGAIIASPFLIAVAPAYIGANAETFTGGVEGIKLALLSTRILPLTLVLSLLFSVVFIFVFSRKYQKRFVTVTSVLFALWMLLPILATQGFLAGLYTDYNRFLYFLLLPTMILIGLAIEHVARFCSRIIDTYLTLTRQLPKTNSENINNSRARRIAAKLSTKLMPHVTRRNIYAGFILGFLLISFVTVPIFMSPDQGIRVQSYYQTMSSPGYDATEWAKENTPEGSVFISDALYGWWFSGFALRPTISAVDPQYLSLAREYEPATIAKNVLDTAFIVDNGLIQVRDDGGYLGRHNPIFLAKLDGDYFPYPYFHFNDNEIEIAFISEGRTQYVNLIDVPVKEMRLEALPNQQSPNQISILVVKENDLFNVTRKVTIDKNSGFADMNVAIQGHSDQVTFSAVRFILHHKYGKPIEANQTAAWIDENMKVCGQLIFDKAQPTLTPITEENPISTEIKYTFPDENKVQVNLLVGVYEFEPAPSPETKWYYYQELITNRMSMEKEEGDYKVVFDYKAALQSTNVSYIICRDFGSLPRFAGDPLFKLVFINNNVAILQVKKT